MMFLLSETAKYDIINTGSNSTWKLIGLVLLCALIIAACYFTTRFIGRKSQGVQNGPGGKNIRAIETFRVTQNKYLQLIRCGDKCVLIGVSKDNITVIAEIDPDSLLSAGKTTGGHKSFKEMISSLSGKGKAEKKSISDIADMSTLTEADEEEEEEEDVTEDIETEDSKTEDDGIVPVSEDAEGSAEGENETKD